MTIDINLPVLHPDQVNAWRLPGRFKAIRCGRRWGKSALLSVIACDAALKGESVGIFTPAYKFQTEIYAEIVRYLQPAIAAASKIDGVIRTITGGRIDFWTLEDERAGRSRKYHKVLIDEAAFAKPNMMDIWQHAIEPTLLDYSGSVVAFSNTRGINKGNFFWRICNEPEHGFVEYHAPAYNNPFVPARLPGESEESHMDRRRAEFERLKASRPPMIYAEEYEAAWVDWSGSAFFQMENFLHDSRPYEMPTACDYVQAVIDTSAKTGKKRDGTAVSFFAFNEYTNPKLFLLDWDIMQMEGDLLLKWLPSVFERLEMFAKTCGARFGSIGAAIEDASTGQVLIPYAQRHGWPVTAIESKLTAMGKVERAYAAAPYVYQRQVGICREPYEKTMTYHERSANHWVEQMVGFRVGKEDDPRAEDDLLDTGCYGIVLALGGANAI